jgi:hypothetical protein
MSVVTNYASNPSFEASTAGVVAVPGTTGVAAITNPSVASGFGSKVAHCQWSTASTAAGGGLYLEIDLATVGLVVGDVVSLGLFYLLTSISNRMQLSAEWRTNVGTISTTSGTAKQTTAATAQTAANKLAASVDASWKLEALTVPATATKLRIRLLSVAGTGYANWSVGSYVRIDGVMVNKGATLADYFDGASGNAYGWVGTAHLSPSVFATPVVALEAFEDMDPSPRVHVTVTDPFPTADSLTVLQLSIDGQIEVRNGVRISAVGGNFVPDYEVPLGVQVQYRVEFFTAAGVSLGLSEPETTQVDVEVGKAIFQDYLAPENAVMVDAEKRFAEDIKSSRTLQLYRAGLDTIALMGEQGLLESVNLRVVTLTEADQVGLDRILNEGTVLIRTMPPMPVPRLLFAVIGTPTRVPINARWGGTMSYFDLVGDQVSRNILDIIVPVVTWQRIIDAYPTWADLIAAHSTWLDLIKNPPPEV